MTVFLNFFLKNPENHAKTTPSTLIRRNEISQAYIAAHACYLLGLFMGYIRTIVSMEMKRCVKMAKKNLKMCSEPQKTLEICTNAEDFRHKLMKFQR